MHAKTLIEMAVNKELWQSVIIEGLYKSNEFLKYMKNVDEYVVGGAIVHIPQSGGASGTVKNRTTLPATVVKRTDTDITYPLDEYTTNPSLIAHIDTVELSYDKMESVIEEDCADMMEMVGDNIIYDVSKEAPAGSKLPTTGSAAAASASGATGNRKIITAADIRAAQTLLDNQNVSSNNRVMVVSPNMLQQLMSDSELAYAFQQVVDLKNGTLPMLYGFQLVKRSNVLTVDGSQDLKAVGAASAVTDSEAALFFQKNAVERAIGTKEIFSQERAPQYYGDIVSFLIRAGSRNRRADNKGYGIIYRDAA